MSCIVRLTPVVRRLRHRTGIATMADGESAQKNDVFNDLDVDRLEVNVVESLCFSCGKNVSTDPSGDGLV